MDHNPYKKLTRQTAKSILVNKNCFGRISISSCLLVRSLAVNNRTTPAIKHVNGYISKRKLERNEPPQLAEYIAKKTARTITKKPRTPKISAIIFLVIEIELFMTKL